MDPRKLETILARLTLVALVLYAPLETWFSLPHGLGSPFYIIDLVAMVFLFVGAMHSLRSRPHSSPGVLCAAYAWTAANGWRATSGRLLKLRDGTLESGNVELWAVTIATILALFCLALSLYLVFRQSSSLSARES